MTASDTDPAGSDAERPPTRSRVARWEAVSPSGRVPRGGRNTRARSVGPTTPAPPAGPGPGTIVAPDEQRLRARRRQRSATPDAGAFARPVAILAGLVAVTLMASKALGGGSTSTAAGLVLALGLTAPIAGVAARMGRTESGFDLAPIVLAGWFLRLIGTFFRFRDPVDAVVYHQEGVRLAAEFRTLNFGAETGREFPGTGFLRWLSGLVHVVVFDNWFAAFVVFTTFSFIGVVLAYRAFARAVPGGNRLRYALLVFWWPSLVFWPSSLGKEAWMILGLGLAAEGASQVFVGRTFRGYVVLAAGLTALSMCRPHVALLALIGFGLAFLVRPGGGSGARAMGKVFGVVLLVVGGSLIAGATADRLKIDSLGSENVQAAFQYTENQTQQGGGQFTAARVRTPLDYPMAFVTVLFRPFPTEANGGEARLTSLEGLAFLALFVLSLRAYRHPLRLFGRIPYLTFSLGYVLAFVYVFAAIANFGILARQRTQVLVFAFVLLAVPGTARRRPDPDADGRTPTDEAAVVSAIADAADPGGHTRRSRATTRTGRTASVSTGVRSRPPEGP